MSKTGKAKAISMTTLPLSLRDFNGAFFTTITGLVCLQKINLGAGICPAAAGSTIF